MARVDESLDTVRAPDCQADGCTNPARFQYTEQKTCSAGAYKVSQERCVEHPLGQYDRGKANWCNEYRNVSKVFGRESADRWAPLEMDPHYFCKKNGGEWCVEGHEDTCPVHGD